MHNGQPVWFRHLPDGKGFVMPNSCAASWYSGTATLTCFSGARTSACPLSKNTRVAAVAAELSLLLISTSRQDLGRDVSGLNLTGTCAHAAVVAPPVTGFNHLACCMDNQRRAHVGLMSWGAGVLLTCVLCPGSIFTRLASRAKSDEPSRRAAYARGRLVGLLSCISRTYRSHRLRKQCNMPYVCHTRLC